MRVVLWLLFLPSGAALLRDSFCGHVANETAPCSPTATNRQECEATVVYDTLSCVWIQQACTLKVPQQQQQHDDDACQGIATQEICESTFLFGPLHCVWYPQQDLSSSSPSLSPTEAEIMHAPTMPPSSWTTQEPTPVLGKAHKIHWNMSTWEVLVLLALFLGATILNYLAFSGYWDVGQENAAIQQQEDASKGPTDDTIRMTLDLSTIHGDGKCEEEDEIHAMYMQNMGNHIL